MTTKKRKFGGKTLAFLMVFYLLLGGVVFPYLNRTTYDDNNPPPPSFPVVVGGGHFAPLTWDYTDINEQHHHYELMREETEFEESLAHLSLKVLSSDTYELQAKTEIHTIRYRYKINKDHTVTPISIERKGLIIWIWSLVCLVAMTVLIAVGQLIWIAWKKYQNRHKEE